MWDTTLVEALDATKDPAVMATDLMQGISTDAYLTTGKPASWPAKWASDTMKQAIRAYADVTFGAGSFDGHGDLQRIAIALQPVPTAVKRVRRCGRKA